MRLADPCSRIAILVVHVHIGDATQVAFNMTGLEPQIVLRDDPDWAVEKQRVLSQARNVTADESLLLSVARDTFRFQTSNLYGIARVKNMEPEEWEVKREREESQRLDTRLPAPTPAPQDILAHTVSRKEAAELAERIQEHLKRTGFLDPSMGVREHQAMRDPMLTVLYNPEKVVQDADGKDVMIIDSLIQSAHQHMKVTYGEVYADFELIQVTMQTLLRSKDTHAKIMMFLCMLAVEDGLRDQFALFYPKDGGVESERLLPFMGVVKAQMEETLNTAYVNVPRPHRHNVDRMLAIFLKACADGYPG